MVRTTSTAIALATVLGLGLSGSAFAGEHSDMSKHGAAQSQLKEADLNQFQEYALSHPQKVQGKMVKDYTGDDIGKIQKVVQSEDTDELYLVVDTEEFLNSATGPSAVKLENFQWQDDDIVLMSQGADLPLDTVDYDSTNFREFKYTGTSERADPSEAAH